MFYTHVPAVKRDKLDHKSEVDIFLGYSNNSKGYRVYNLETKRILVSRDVKFDEVSKWNWEKCQAEDNLQELNFDDEEENYDSDTDFPVKGTRSLQDVYTKCNVAALEPKRYDEAAEFENWRATIQEQMKMIEKNQTQTWRLVDRPINKNVIGVKWVYRTKLNPDGFVNKLKARLVVKGYLQ